MFKPEAAEAIASLTLQGRVKNLEEQSKILAAGQKSILEYLREVVTLISEISEEASEE